MGLISLCFSRSQRILFNLTSTAPYELEETSQVQKYGKVKITKKLKIT